jgi:mannose-6-phosphate isomerase-like protein (cupin superfamily)
MEEADKGGPCHAVMKEKNRGGTMTGQKIPKKFEKYVVTDLPRPVSIAGHKHPAPFWVTPDMFPGVNIGVAGHEVSGTVGAPHAGPHVHEKEGEIWVAPSENRGDVVIEAHLEDETFLVEAPFAIFIPAGTLHYFKVVKCESPRYVMGIKVPV